MSDLLSRLTADRLEELAGLLEHYHVGGRTVLGLGEAAAVLRALAGAERAIVAGSKAELRSKFSGVPSRDGLSMWTDHAASWIGYPTLISALASVAKQEEP